MNFPSIDIQGSILSNDLMGKIRSELATYQLGKDFNPDLTNSKLKDEISLAWQDAKAQWAIFQGKLTRLKISDSGTTETRNFWISPLLTNLNYNLTFNRSAEEIDGKSFPIGYRDSSLDNFPLYVGGYYESLDKRPENKQLRISPHAMLQEYLNYSEHLYGIVTNGKQLRLLRDASRITRLSYVEFNLEKMMEEDLYSDFVIFYRLLHASRMPRTISSGAESIIEKYHREGIEAGSTIRSKLGDAVKGAIKNLANGFINHPDNTVLREAVRNCLVDPSDYYHHQLRIIYRLLFLFVIEERNLVYAESKKPETKRFNQIYFNYYSLLRLRKLAKRQPAPDADKHYDLWQSLIGTFSLFENKEIGERMGIMSLQGDLFNYNAISNEVYDLHNCRLSNAVLLNVFNSLGYFENDNRIMIAVNYGGLDVEEFGSVYEGLLELKLVINKSDGFENYSCSFGDSDERGTSGSHYTPEELVQPLIKHSLDYLIEDRIKPWQQKKASRETTVQSLLTLKICDVSCGSGHILLSAARRLALIIAWVQTDEEQPNPLSIRKAMKEVIRNCIYGVDKNPLAVELCKIALWLEAYNPGEPLNFLDHHIKCGDAVVGLAHLNELNNGIANEAFKTLSKDDKAVSKSLRDKNAKEQKERVGKSTQLSASFAKTAEISVQETITEYRLFNSLPEDTPEEIEIKATSYQHLVDGKGYGFIKSMADTQIAQFFISKTAKNLSAIVTDSDYRLMLNGHKIGENEKFLKAKEIANERRFFHWFLEFPEVFDKGGFDCLLGNPPYLGGANISTSYHHEFTNFLYKNYEPARNRADLVTYFLRRINSIIAKGGFLAIITTNSITEGDTRSGGLDILLKDGSIVYANKSLKWPGVANLSVSIFSFIKSDWNKRRFLNQREVSFISSYFEDNLDIGNPQTLLVNSGQIYLGCKILGDGFSITSTEYERCLDENQKNKDVLFKSINGDEVNNLFDFSSLSWIINFKDILESEAKKYELPYNIALERVKPERILIGDKSSREKWWLYARNRGELYAKLSKIDTCFIWSRTTKYLAITKSEPAMVFTDAICVLATSKMTVFSFLQSTIHEIWARKYSSSLETRLRYSIEDGFETFPFPPDLTLNSENLLAEAGEVYHDYRKKLMLQMRLGLTKTYNLFHSAAINPITVDRKDKQVIALERHLEKTRSPLTLDDVVAGMIKLRLLHQQLDKLVIHSYDWYDLELNHNFYSEEYLPENDRIRFTIHPEARKEVLKRLLELNHELYSEEQAISQAKKNVSIKVSKATKQKNLITPIQFPMRPESAYGAIYSVQDVVRITKLSSTTVKRWLDILYTEGYEGISIDNGSKDQPMLLNFYGIHELIVIYDLRVINKIPLKEILDARKWLVTKFGTGPNFYPFTSEKVLDTISKAGKQIIFKEESSGDFITLGKGNSQLNLAFIKEILKRIVFDKEMVSRLYLSDTKLIAIDPTLAGGRPCTVDNGILIDSIKSVFMESPDVSYIANVYEISEDAVKDALSFDRASILN